MAATRETRIWLEATIQATAFEIELDDLLVRIDPEHVLHPIASDRSRGWLLLPDGGPSLAGLFAEPEFFGGDFIAGAFYGGGLELLGE